MTNRLQPSRQIADAVTQWSGVEAGPGLYGALAFKVARKEIGHLHGDTVAHFVFDHATWLILKAEGRVGYHPVFPRKIGPAARAISDDGDIRDVIDMMRINYDRVVARASPDRQTVS